MSATQSSLNWVILHLRPKRIQEQQRMISYLNILKSADQQGRDKWHLNTTEVAQLEGQRSDAYDRSANWISNLLCYGYGICRAPLTGGIEGPPQSFRRPQQGVALPEFEFGTAPNPADAWVTFNYRFTTAQDHAFISVRDPLGRELTILPMKNERGQLVLDTRELAKGLYTVAYLAGDRVLQLDKLIIQ